jgi:uncharacterized protein (DUF2141 family)
MMRACVLSVVMALSGVSCAAQAAPAAGSYTISGVVRSATTGAPLDHAQVALSTAGEEETQVAETVTGEGGTFRFDRLPAGKYALAASRRGYNASHYQEHEGGYSTAIVTGPELVSEGLRFDLFPTAVIGGTITDDNGDPVSGAQVTLYRQQQQDGELKITSAATDTTRDDGTYEFDRLHAGSYYIGVSATPWYAFRPQQLGPIDGMPAPPPPPRSPLDVAYPITFYANATDSGSATPIQLTAGDHSQLDLTLHAVPAVHLEVRAPKPDMNHGFAIPQLSEDVFGSEEYQPSPQVTMRNTGDQVVIDLGAVAPGHYLLHDFIVNGVSRRASVDLSGDQSIDFTAPENAIELSGKVEMASGAALPAATMVQLTPSGRGATATAPVKSDGTFELPAIAPGEYNVQVVSSTGLLSVVQMAASGAGVHGHRITVGTDSVLLAATLAGGSVAVSGFARKDGKGLGGALVLLVPEDAQDNADLIRQDQSDSDGSFTLNRVVPGNYTLVAIENGWSMEWGRREVMAPYLARGVKLHIIDSPPRVELPSAVEVQ